MSTATADSVPSNLDLRTLRETITALENEKPSKFRSAKHIKKLLRIAKYRLCDAERIRLQGMSDASRAFLTNTSNWDINMENAFFTLAGESRGRS